MRFARTVLIIARNELADSIRSRRTAVLLLLYLAGAMAGTLLFIKTLHQVEAQVAETLGVQAVKQAGSVTAALWKSAGFRHILIGLAGDRDLAERLLGIPPLALFYGWISFAFSPLLTVLMSSSRMAEEVWLGSVRFVLFRSSRLAWCLGKFLGQAFQLLPALLLSAAGAWCAGRWSMSSFEPMATAGAMLVFVWKAWVYTIAYLGLASGISLVCRSPHLATALALVWLTVVSALARVAEHFAGDGWRRIWDAVALLTPASHYADLWRFDPAHLVPAMIFLIALGFLYLFAGYAVLQRKDV
jgi:hypothetical protein